MFIQFYYLKSVKILYQIIFMAILKFDLLSFFCVRKNLIQDMFYRTLNNQERQTRFSFVPRPLFLPKLLH